jgi:hypothetical protein
MTETEQRALKAFLITVLLLLTATSLVFAQADPAEITKTFRPDTRRPIKVDVRMQGGELHFSAVPRGAEGRARYRYDQKRFEGELRWDQEENALVAITEMHGLHIESSPDSTDRSESSLEILVPRGAVVELDLNVKWGYIDLDGEDLKFDALAVDITGGEFIADFPTRAETRLRRIDLELSMGEMDVKGLGNLSWETLDVNGAMGSLDIDLTGGVEMTRRATIDLEIGEMTVTVPADRKVEARVSKWGFLANVDYPESWEHDGRYLYSRRRDEGKTDLFLDIRGGIGDITIRQR